MKKIFGKTHRSYYKKILILMFAFVLAVILPFTALLYRKSQQNMLKNINQSNEQVLRQMKFNYTYFSENISALCLSTFFRYDVNAVMYNSEVDYNQLYLTLKNLRDNVLQSQPSLASIQIYNGQRKEWYSTESDAAAQGEILQRFVGEQDSTPKLRPVLRELSETNGQIETSQYVFSYFMYEYQEPSSGQDSYLVLNQNANRLIDNLTGAVSGSLPSSIYLAGASGDIFGYQKEETSVNEEELVRECMQKYISGRNEEKSQGYYVEKYNGKKFLVSYIDLEDRGNYIIMVQAYEQIFSNLIQLRNDFLVLCCIFGVIGILMLIHLSRKIYRPVNSLMGYVSGLEGESESQAPMEGEDEFAHLRDVYQKNNDVKEKLLQEKKSTRESLRRYLLANLLEESTEKNWEKYRKSMPESSLYGKEGRELAVAIFYLDSYTENKYGFTPGDSSLLLDTVSNVMTEMLTGYIAEPVKKENSCLVIILGSKEKLLDTADLRERISYVQRYIKTGFDVTVSAAVSHSSCNPEELTALYEQARKYGGYRLVYGPGCLLGAEECRKNMENPDNTYPRELNRRLKESLKLGSMEQIRGVLDRIQESVSDLSCDNISISMMSLVTEVNTVMNEINMARNLPVTIHFNEMYKRVIEVEFISILFEELSEYISSILSETYQKKEKENDKEKIFVQTVMEFVNQNYTDVNLSSQSIADYMNMSGRYIMKKFKQCTGLSLNEYILDIRMKQAAELLLHSKLPVNKIADNIGIENENYFYRLFKKVYGCTPREFSSRKDQ